MLAMMMVAVLDDPFGRVLLANPQEGCHNHHDTDQDLDCQDSA
jgi:hypothetical protein